MNPLLLQEFLTLEEAAELLVGAMPTIKEDIRNWKVDCARWRGLLAKAIADKELVATVREEMEWRAPPQSSPPPFILSPLRQTARARPYVIKHTTIPKANLIAWCEKIGYRPKDLFPEKLPLDYKEDPREINTLLELIYLVTKLQYGDLGQPFRVADEIIKDAAAQGEPVFLDRKTIADKVKKALEKHSQSNRTNR